ncbi:MAG: LysE family transporter [Chitinivibrionales bacterium]
MESFITLSIIGLLVGIVFSMPIWGPVSIFIATSGLQGRWIYCVSVALGSGIIDSLVCFIVILGFTKVMGVLSPFVPYLFLCGAAVLFIMGTRIIMTGIDPHRTGGAIKKRAINKNMAGFWAGAILNASNPSILFGWLSSSFLAISFAASLGFNVGGFDPWGRVVCFGPLFFITGGNSLDRPFIFRLGFVDIAHRFMPVPRSLLRFWSFSSAPA